MAGMFLYLGVFGCPMFVCPHMFVCPQGVHTPICPHTLLCLCVFLEALQVVGGYNGLPFVLGHPPLHHPCMGCLPFNYTPTLSCWPPCALVCFRDISMLCGHFPSVEGFGGVSPISWGHQHLRCHMLILVHFL